MCTLKGSIFKIFPQDSWGSGFRRRRFWLKELYAPPGKLKQTFELEVQYDACDTIEDFMHPKIEIECTVEIRGKMKMGSGSEDRVYNTLVCTNIKIISS